MSALSCAVAALVGIASHIGFFHRAEHHLNGITYLQVFLAVCTISSFALVHYADQTVKETVGLVSAVAGSWLVGLWTSLLVYRVLLHPLNKFSGPFAARFSSFWISFHVGNSQAYKTIHDLHKKYGQFVRYGSNEISITHPEAVNIVYGYGTKCKKAAWYDNDYPLTSMHTTRDRKFHDQRRRVWSTAFSDKSLRGYESRVQSYGDQLVRQLRAFSGQSVDVTKWFSLLAYDVMGDLAFGKNFGMLQSGEEHFAVRLLSEGMGILAFMVPPWFFRILTSIPGLAAGYWKFINYCNSQLDARLESKPEIPDIMSALLENFGSQKPTGVDLSYLQGDARLIIVAGSDTTSSTITHVFHYLARDPELILRLREEITPKVSADGHIVHREIQDLPYLNGVINEGLRLHPPVPTALPRITPPEGITIDGTHIPGNMTVICPAYAIARDEATYGRAEEFLPERWSEQPELVKNKTAFAPFSTGTYGCIGRPLALMELRLVIAKLVIAYDITFAPGETGHALLNETKDHFTSEPAELRLTFRERATA
ncbi:cytochrome P450 monooxygenase [Saccharata proteae CBS 121410]|uniref:Cytochrome P450 monooxygenase n=1 Tax=Saccharata proteae CBS 121410 TaxID=1314787 RepID=A0A9P4LVG5_9PEZI|nr:cytochrome P450 monooxygenase [Saccharata proteae CBS 121410]